MRAAAFALVLLVAGCGGEDTQTLPLPPQGGPAVPPGTAPGASAAPAASAGPATPVALLQGKASQPKEAVLAEIRKRTLSDEDFIESDTNRDPFRSYLSTFAVQMVVNRKQHKIVLEKFALDELKLVAIISGEGGPARVMFVDPSGMGVTVGRGDHISKADALVTRIAPDRIFLQLEEDDAGKARSLERVIELHAGEGLAQ